MDVTDGTVLTGKNVHVHLPIASTTKIMTALIALQLGRLSDRITVPKSAFDYEQDATAMGLHAGDVATLRELLYGLLLPSGADAANAIAIHYAGSESRFVSRMNAEAKQLGMRDTHYVNAHGLTAKNAHSSVYDLAILAQYMTYLPDFMKITSTRSYVWHGHVLKNLNHVLFWYPGVDGIKPGYTDEAGLCQVLDAQRNGRQIVAVLLNTPDLVIDARNLLNFGLRDFSWIRSPLTRDSPSLALQGVDQRGTYRYFVGSGHYVRGEFWDAYQKNGGYKILGYPRTEPLVGGQTRVQFFQNGALSVNLSTHIVSRLPLGLTPLPTAHTVPPFATTTPTPRPSEGSLHLPPLATPSSTSTPIRKTGSSKSLTPTPLPTAIPPKQATDKVFLGFQHAHVRSLGLPVAKAYRKHRYAVQIFTYGALVYDPQKHTVSMLPLGDGVLRAKHFLPEHPGNTYPEGFASPSVLKAISWPPYDRKS